MINTVESLLGIRKRKHNKASTRFVKSTFPMAGFSRTSYVNWKKKNLKLAQTVSFKVKTHMTGNKNYGTYLKSTRK